MSGFTATAIPAMRPLPVPLDRARNLFRWNAVLAALHFVQFLAMLALSFQKNPIVTAPILSSYLAWDPATRTLIPEQRAIFDLPLGPTVAGFFLLSAVAHASLAFPFRRWYEREIASGRNRARWIEYSLSSSLMIVVIASLTGIREIGTLVGIFGANAAMILFGWSMEVANEGRSRTQWSHFVFGCIAGAIPWVVIGVALLTGITAPGAAPIPAFVIAIYVSLFVSFNVFAINMVLQYGRVGRWRDYLYGERAYMLLSLIAKSLLAWQVWSGTLRP